MPFGPTWDTVNSKNTHAAIRRGYIDGAKVDERDIIEIYNPKVLFIEEEDNRFDKYGYLTSGNDAIATFSQFYKINHVSLLLKEYIENNNNEEYDFVMKFRFDADIVPLIEDITEVVNSTPQGLEPIRDENFLEIYEPLNFFDLDKEFFYCEKDGDTKRLFDNKTNTWTCYPNWLHDKTFISNYENYMIYADLYNHLEYLIKKNGTTTSEHLVYDWVVSTNNIKIKKTRKLFCNCVNTTNKYIKIN